MKLIYLCREYLHYFKRKKDLLCEPDGVEQSPSIPSTLNFHKLVKTKILDSVARTYFYLL